MPQKTIYVPNDLWATIQRVAHDTDKAPHAVMIEAMREGMDRPKKEEGK